MRSERTLPLGWQDVALVDITSVCRRGRAPAYQGGETVVINQKCVRHATEVDLEFAKRTNEATKPLPDWVVVQDGDILVNSTGGGTLGRSAWLRKVPQRMTVDSHVAIVRPRRELVLPAYLGWFLHSHQASLEDLATGSTQQSELSPNALQAVRVPLAPLAEQDRIVERLEDILMDVEAGIAAFNRSLVALTQYRAALVRDALDGPWPRVPLTEALTSLRNGIFVSRPAASGPGIPIYRISAVRQLKLDVHDVRYAPTDLPDHERFLTQPGDLLFTRYSGNPEFVGACARVPEGAAPALHPDKLIRGVVDRSVALPEFLELACSGGQTWAEIRAARKTTAGQVGIAGKQLAAVTVPLPPLDVQKRIVTVSAQKLFAADGCEARFRQLLGDTERLTRSVLYDAFTPGAMEADANNGQPVLDEE